LPEQCNVLAAGIQFNFQTTHLKQHLSIPNIVYMQQNIPQLWLQLTGSVLHPPVQLLNLGHGLQTF